MADAATNINIEQQADGSVVIDLSTRRSVPDKPEQESGFDANLADGYLDDQTLSIISADLIRGVDADMASRQEWVQNYNDGLKLLSILLEKNSIDSKTSRVRHPMLMWAVVKFQAGAAGEMLPVAGPCKVESDGPLDPKIAEALERDMNHFIKVVASEYYPDTDRGLFYLGYGGTIFKKVYWCPIRDRPSSECVYLPDLIISNDTTDIPNAARVTHRVQMSEQQILQLQDKGYFADVTIMRPSPSPTSTQTAMAGAIGVQAIPSLPEDMQHTLYETYTLLDLGRFSDEYREEGQSSGIALPYRVTIDRDSRKIYELRRNWREADEKRLARRRFFKWGLVPGIGYLDLGYLNLLGNHTLATTALLRVLVDAGIYSIWPGGVRVKGMRMETNEIRPGPGEFPEIDTSGLPIASAIMPMPFKGPAMEVLQLLQHMEGQAEKTTGQIEVPTGSGLTNVPVGTIMASIDQQAQIDIALHRRLHNAQKEELMALRELLLEAGPRGMELLKQGDETQPYTAEQLGSASLIPASDPNTPARVHRVMQATVLETLANNHPTIYNQREVQKRILDIAKISSVDEILMPILPPNPGPQDPTMAIAAMQAQLMQQKNATDAADKAAHLKLDQRAQMLKEWQAQNQAELDRKKLEEQVALDQQKAQTAAQADASKTRASAMGETQASARDAAIKQASADQQAQVDLTNADKDRESRERIAAMQGHVSLLEKGIEQLGNEKALSTKEDKSG